MAWRRREPKWRWRDYLTAEETALLAKCDALKVKWQQLNKVRAGVVNRAIHRAKYAAGVEGAKAKRR